MKSLVRESKKHYVNVYIKSSNLNAFIKYSYKLGIELLNINYINTKEITIKILKSDYIKIKKNFKEFKIKKQDDLGIYSIKPFIKKHLILLICLMIGVFLLYFLTRIIVKVDVIHSKKEIRELVTKELDSLGIRRLTLKKSYEELQDIKKKILDKYPTRLEWLEIEIQGMNILVRIEERIITKNKEENRLCNIVAKKDALITKIVTYAGETTKRIDNYVKKGEIIISGNIKLYEEIKSSICAKGEVYGEVWYTVDVSVPLNYEEHIETGRKRNNFTFETNKKKCSILRGRFEHYNTSNKYLFGIGNVKFYFDKESEYKIIKKTYSEEAAIKRGNELALSKMQINLKDDDLILMQKVLKKSINNSTMYLEIFFSVSELISEISEFELNEQVGE